MKHELKLSAIYTNVKNIFIDPVVNARIKCSNDNKVHNKLVNISSESIRRNDKNQIINFKAKCSDCQRDMSVNMHINEKNNQLIWLNFQQTESKTVILSDKKGDDFILAQFKTNGCVLEKIEGLKINVLANDDSLFMDINVENGYWADNMKNNKVVSVKSLKWELVDAKGNIK